MRSVTNERLAKKVCVVAKALVQLAPRVCSEPDCEAFVVRTGTTGPWPNRCPEHSLQYAQHLRKTRYKHPRKYTEPKPCCEVGCENLIPIPTHGKPPKRCPTCAVAFGRSSAVERQQAFRARRKEETVSMAKAAAMELMEAISPPRRFEVEEAHVNLCKVLTDMDRFWVRWNAFAETILGVAGG